jgi:hypothetical protein
MRHPGPRLRHCPLRRLRARLPVAYSCKAHGVCRPCNTCRVENATPLADHVIPHLPVRQWALSVPKRLRYFLYADPAIQNLGLDVLLSAVEQGLRAPCTVVQGSMARVGAVAFIHRFGALLKPHLHFHCVVLDGLLEAGTEAELTARFHETPALSAKQLTDIRGKGERPPHATRTHAARSARTGGRRGNGRLGSRRWFQPRGRVRSKPTTGPALSACYATSPVRSLRSNDCSRSTTNIWSTRASSQDPAAVSACSQVSLLVHSSKGVHASEVGL